MTGEIDRVREVLRVTGVMTAGQAAHLARLEGPELHLAGLVVMPVPVVLRHQQASSRQRVQMVAVRNLRGRTRGSALLHTCGALELVLRTVPLDEFDPAALVMPTTTPAGETPDLEYRTAAGELVAYEFDTGAYKHAHVRAKMARFTADYDAVVYGTTVRRRHQDLTTAVQGELRLGTGTLTLHHVASLD